MKSHQVLIALSLGVLLSACASTGATGRGGAGSGGTSLPSSGSEGGGLSPVGNGTGSVGSGGAAADAGAGVGTGSSAGRGDGSADTGAPAKTPAEQRAAIDGKLDASLGRFDDQLRREQQRTASERDTRATARADGAAVDAADAADGEVGTGKVASDDIRRDRAGDLRSDGLKRDSDDASGTADGNESTGPGGTGGRVSGGGGGAANRAIPSGENDDIVARRLRRAAENETDPELKEKLWNEYRDYKENTKGSK